MRAAGDIDTRAPRVGDRVDLAVDLEPAFCPSSEPAHSKRDAISRLQESALHIFSSKGFDGTSLRNIADHADVPLSTINRYFGSKLDLFNEIERGIWSDVNRCREAAFRKPRYVDEAGQPTLRSVIHAFVHPVVLLAFGENGNLPASRFLREYVTRKYHESKASPFLPVAERWIVAMMQACPHLPRVRAVWALGFTVNVTFSDQLHYGSYDPLMPSPAKLGAIELTDMIVDFCEAGIRAIARDDNVLAALNRETGVRSASL